MFIIIFSVVFGGGGYSDGVHNTHVHCSVQMVVVHSKTRYFFFDFPELDVPIKNNDAPTETDGTSPTTIKVRASLP